VEKELYGKPYAQHDEQIVYAQPERLEVGEQLGQSMYTQKTDWKTKRDKNKRKQVAAEGALNKSKSWYCGKCPTPRSGSAGTSRQASGTSSIRP
jgi:predicted Holliday junction resolvase-like endonuclease